MTNTSKLVEIDHVKEKMVEIVGDALDSTLLNITDSVVDCVVDALIANGVTVQEWISVKDRLPEENGIYLTLNKKRQYEFHIFKTGKRMWQGIWEEDGVTHWMPLPQPPKRE